jgi:hypothetical protein
VSSYAVKEIQIKKGSRSGLNGMDKKLALKIT